MKYSEFENIMSIARMSRYTTATLNTRKAMTLYRLNLRLSQELFTIICCFEISLRNAINKQCIPMLGNDWLRNGVLNGGFFDNGRCRLTRDNINDAVLKLNHNYTHSKLVAELGFGFWRFMFAQNQFTATGRILLRIFPSKPVSTPVIQYNNTHLFNKLAQINHIRNRIAHHEPICFLTGQPVKDTTYVREHYTIIKTLFQWMEIDESSLLYGLDHVENICDQIDAL
ncbi:MAG: CAAX protease [Flavobacterium sp.]|nr:MAG: CAAX protease [Flavobacterium sp.]